MFPYNGWASQSSLIYSYHPITSTTANFKNSEITAEQFKVVLMDEGKVKENFTSFIDESGLNGMQCAWYVRAYTGM